MPRSTDERFVAKYSGISRSFHNSKYFNSLMKRTQMANETFRYSPFYHLKQLPAQELLLTNITFPSEL